MSYTLLGNQVESTLTVAYVEDTSTEFAIAAMTNFPTAAGFVLVDDGSEWVLKKYSATDVPNKKLQTLSNAGAVYESAGAAGHTFAVGTEVWLVQTADYLLELVSATGLRIQDFLWADAPTELTISVGGVITVTQMLHKVDTNADGATDNLDTINGGTVAQFIVLRAEHTDRTVVLKHGTGNLELGGSDVSLDATDQYVMLLYDATLSKWVMVGGGGGGGGDLLADGSVPLTANWDVGGFDLRAQNLTADALTAGRVVFTGANGLLSEEAALAWTTASARLDITKTAIGATQGDYGLALINTTAAAAGAQQWSPPVRWRGYGWKTDAVAASQSVDFRSFVRPIQGAAAPTGGLDFQSSINGGAYSNLVTILSSGSVGIGITNPASSLHISAATAALQITDSDTPNSYVRIWSNGDSQLRIEKFSNTGVSLIDVDPIANDGTSQSSFRFFRNVNTTGVAFFQIFLADGSGTANAQIAGKGTDTYFAANNGNVGIGTTTFDGTAAGCLTIGNGTEPAAHTDNQIYIYSKDATTTSLATLGIYSEEAVSAGAPTLSHKVKVWWNGVEYWLGLDAV